MLSHRAARSAALSATRTAGAWRPWERAWDEAAYGPDGFWSSEQPGPHFATAVGVGTGLAERVSALAPEGVGVVVDVGAGDGGLLAGLVGLLGRHPGVRLVGVDRRPRPPGLDPRVDWVVDHLDVARRRWRAGGPDAWCAGAGTPLLVAHEWLDDLPVAVVAHDGDIWREVEVDGAGRERAGRPASAADAAWLARWWPAGRRAEVGRVRDDAWAQLVAVATRAGGQALAVDYGHEGGARPVDGSLAAYGRGRRREPVPDGTVNLTAGVAVDALAAAGESVGAVTLLRDRQAAVLGAPPPPAGDPLAALVARSRHAALTSPGRWGEAWWLLQGALA